MTSVSFKLRYFATGLEKIGETIPSRDSMSNPSRVHLIVSGLIGLASTMQKNSALSPGDAVTESVMSIILRRFHC